MISVEILVGLEDKDGITFLSHEIITKFTKEHKYEELFAVFIEREANKIFDTIRKDDIKMLSQEESDDILNNL
jgi:hypothetical protein